MKQVVITKSGAPEVLEVREKPDPLPGENEVRIIVRAAGINFADILARQGLYPDAPALPCTVGYEVSGVVDEIGPGVETSWKGKEVIALSRFNGQSDILVVPAAQVFLKPAELSFEEGAAIPVTYLTAFQSLVVMGGLRADETVLIHNVGGGVGLAALDIALKVGARTIGTASGGKHEFLKERGLEHAIDYRKNDWEEEVQELTDGRGVELIIDPIGGGHWKKSYRNLRASGRLGMFGISTVSQSGIGSKVRMLGFVMSTPFYHPIGLMNQNKGVFGVNMGHLWHETTKVAGWMAEIIKGVDEGWIRPHVDRAFQFEEAARAHEYIEARKNIGKVVLIP